MPVMQAVFRAMPQIARPAKQIGRMVETLPKITLVLGGARSGKSRYAENLVLGSGLAPVYLATAQAGDSEMAARIAAHQSRRGNNWRCVEEPLDLTGALASADDAGNCILVDCLTLWITNLMLSERDVEAAVEAVVADLPRIASTLIFVSNETGLGIVPDNALARRFRDLNGVANQKFAAAADQVIFMAAGLPLTLKQPS